MNDLSSFGYWLDFCGVSYIVFENCIDRVGFGMLVSNDEYIVIRLWVINIDDLMYKSNFLVKFFFKRKECNLVVFMK